MTDTHTPWQRGRRAGERGVPRDIPHDLTGSRATLWLDGYDSCFCECEIKECGHEHIDPQENGDTEKKAVGGLNDYWLTRINNPQRSDQAPYTAECEDIISSLGMSFDEGCAFKALWRMAQLRKGLGKPGATMLYDAEKTEHYGRRIAERERNK